MALFSYIWQEKNKLPTEILCLSEREKQFVLVSTAMEMERKAEQAKKLERQKGRRGKGRRR
ncbi:hypothetical protein C7J99_26490 [Brevibacillus brevis]|nr:hypothetical protein C7J99_26490 [Brevibacillus brevis]GEC92437.1 hypothetical protein BBR01nite_47680 [Brevibacillus brevis]